VFELAERDVELVELDQGAAERDAGRQVPGVKFEAGAADVDRFLEVAGAAAFLGELGEGDRRRVPLDPASKVIDPLTIGHCGYGTVTVEVVVPERPSVSVTVNRTV
jgi:hypothetical protein